MIDERSEQYLKAIGQMEEEGEQATTSSLARSLGVSMPSVTEMLQRLSARGLVNHQRRVPSSRTRYLLTRGLYGDRGASCNRRGPVRSASLYPRSK